MQIKLGELIESKCVVRVSSNTWSSDKGLHIRKDIVILKRQSYGYNHLTEDISHIGAQEVIHRIVNLDEVCDGIYELITCNESRDWETGYIDDYDYKLIPNQSEPQHQTHSEQS